VRFRNQKPEDKVVRNARVLRDRRYWLHRISLN